jgi:DUF4097 and DUF4098 domain-containing protein YvlB
MLTNPVDGLPTTPQCNLREDPMKTGMITALTALALIPLAACSDAQPTVEKAERSYHIAEPVTTLVIEAHTALVMIEAGDGPITVKEIRGSTDRAPTTSHRVDGSTLRLTESGCGDAARIRCDVEYQIRVPKATATEVTTGAGAVILRGLDGRMSVTTGAGAVSGDRLTMAEATVMTEAGATELHFLEAPSSVHTESEAGPVEVRVPGNQSYAVDISATVGGSEVSVTRDPAAAHHINVRTGIGGVRVAPA